MQMVPIHTTKIFPYFDSETNLLSVRLNSIGKRIMACALFEFGFTYLCPFAEPEVQIIWNVEQLHGDYAKA